MKRIVLLVVAASLLLATSDSKLTERQRAIHVLDRLAFGARPGDVDRMLTGGVDAWIERQLHPETIADRVLDARLVRYETLRMSNEQIGKQFVAPLMAARAAAKNRAAGDPRAAAESSAAADPRPVLLTPLSPDARPRQLLMELQSQRILRAAESERQLNEVLVDFWMNHFNVFAGKGADRFLLTEYERDTIRPRIFGRFEDLLLATAKSPAMLFYLDNARSRAGAINENYARELMELHTLGVDAGYTQKDVTELARVLTGWSIERPQQGGAFVFRPRLHDRGAKTVLGVRFPAGGGIEEGERMIALLARQPATAHRIAYKLSQRLVADEPPPALVDRVAKRFLATDGDLRETVRAVIASPEFRDPRYYRAKVKTPLEYTISAVRAVGARIDDPLPLARGLQQGGEALYGAQAPTGYSDQASAWVNTGALLQRLNFAIALAGNQLPGVRSDVAALVDVHDDDHAVDALAQILTGGALTDGTKQTIRERGGKSLTTIAALILGSPEFQKQ
jgi:uncharacterized protein (DUF1800 family)